MVPSSDAARRCHPQTCTPPTSSTRPPPHNLPACPRPPLPPTPRPHPHPTLHTNLRTLYELSKDGERLAKLRAEAAPVVLGGDGEGVPPREAVEGMQFTLCCLKETLRK